jgi:hypothetical protein
MSRLHKCQLLTLLKVLQEYDSVALAGRVKTQLVIVRHNIAVCYASVRTLWFNLRPSLEGHTVVSPYSNHSQHQNLLELAFGASGILATSTTCSAQSIRLTALPTSQPNTILHCSRVRLSQSTETPLFFKSALACSICFTNSSCASGTSLKEKTPYPSLAKR